MGEGGGIRVQGEAERGHAGADSVDQRHVCGRHPGLHRVPGRRAEGHGDSERRMTWIGTSTNAMPATSFGNTTETTSTTERPSIVAQAADGNSLAATTTMSR